MRKESQISPEQKYEVDLLTTEKINGVLMMMMTTTTAITKTLLKTAVQSTAYILRSERLKQKIHTPYTVTTRQL